MPPKDGRLLKLCGLTQSDCAHPILWFTLSYTIKCPRSEMSAKGSAVHKQMKNEKTMLK